MAMMLAPVLSLTTQADDYADARGTMLPSTSLVRYGATQLPTFAIRDLGFMA